MTKTLRELHEKATPAPWATNDDWTGPGYATALVHPTIRGGMVVGDVRHDADGALTVAMRNALPLYFALEDAAREWRDARLSETVDPAKGVSADNLQLHLALAALDGAA